MLADWDLRFPNSPPLGWRLRETFADRWVRFHSLPGSKRYPDDEAEMAEVLARHNAVLSELTEFDPRVVLVTTGYSDSPEPLPTYPAVAAFDPGGVPWRSIPMHEVWENGDEPYYWHLCASEWEWRPGVFNPLVRLIADEVVANVHMVAPDCQWLLHPYDGGMDVIAKSARHRDLLRARHSAWLSARADGK